MSNLLSGITAKILGRQAPVYAWPVVQLGLGADGNLAPVSTNAAGNVNVATPGANAFATTNITAAADGTATLAARATRRSVSIVCMEDSPETVWYGPASGVNASTGARLEAGQSQVVDTTSAIYFFGAAGTGTIQCVETYD